jgi:hypothetical protein
MKFVVMVWYCAIVSVESETHRSSQELKRSAFGKSPFIILWIGSTTDDRQDLPSVSEISKLANSTDSNGLGGAQSR